MIDLLQTDGCRNEGRLASKCKMQVPGTDTSFPSPGIPQAELCSSVVHHHRQDGRGSRPHLKATKSYQHWICCLILATEMWRERVFLFAWRQGIPFKLGQARTTSVSNKILFLFIFSAGPPTAFCQWHRDGGQCRLEPGPLPCFYLAAERLGAMHQAKVQDTWECCDATVWSIGNAPNSPKPPGLIDDTWQSYACDTAVPIFMWMWLT